MKVATPTFSNDRGAASTGSNKPTFQPGTYVVEQDASGRVNKFLCEGVLGRGGFAKCYAVSDSTGSYALKVVSRSSLEKPKTLQKLHSEIAIHRRMKHKHIVNFIRTFKDRYNVYMLLEKCNRGTLLDLLKIRCFSVPETQYVMLQCLSAMQYMQDMCVIHRDLKPGNIMLDSELNIKIGDFGLAAELQYDGERKRTICGTPNYIAPEIIDRASRGHSYEVDTWSLGVILYTLLVGQPPFQMDDVESTYLRIRQCRYSLPSTVPEAARDLIAQILQSSPSHRPTLMDIRQHHFFSFLPPPTTVPETFSTFGLPMPTTTTNVAPCVDRGAPVVMHYPPATSTKEGVPTQREILGPVSANVPPHGIPTSPRHLARPSSPKRYEAVVPPPPPSLHQPQPMLPPSGGFGTYFHDGGGRQPVGGSAGERVVSRPHTSSRQPPVQYFPPLHEAPAVAEAQQPIMFPPPLQNANKIDDDDRQQLTTMHDNLHQTLCGGTPGEEEEVVAPSDIPAPKVWVTECADFSTKYGMAYRLNTGHTGAHYNDSTKMVWEPISGRVEYYYREKVRMNTRSGAMGLFAKDVLKVFYISECPGDVEKKVTLIKYFKSYLSRVRSVRDKVEVVTCSPYVPTSPLRLSEPHVSSDFVYVKQWMRTAEALVFRLSNKTIQVSFNDKAEVILSLETKVGSYTDPNGHRVTFHLSSVATKSREAADRLRTTKNILYKLITDQRL